MGAAMGLDDSTLRAPAPAVVRAAAPRRLALTLLAHPDPRRIGELALWSGTTRVSRLEPELGPPGGGAAAPLGDRHLSRRGFAIRETPSGGAVIELEPGAGAAGPRVDGRALAGRAELTAAQLDAGTVLELADRVALLLHRRARPRGGPALDMVGASEAIDDLRDQLHRVADLAVPVCLLGETGSGKELAAAALHRLSGRRGGFVALNMAAVPPATAVSQLFGHVRGAFTGADAGHRGAFAQAAGGTLFLDELADTSDEVQAMLLRAVETGEVAALGAERADRIDARLVVASDRALDDLVRAGRFREPLWHRVAGYIVRIPPLRARRDDIPRVLLHFLRAELAAAGEPDHLAAPAAETDPPWLPAPLVAALCRAPWPGNLRELRNTARRLVVASRGADRLVLDDELAPAAADDLPTALERHRWHVAATAAALGISRTTLYARIDACPAIRKAGDLGRDELTAALATSGRDLDALAAQLKVSRRGLQLRLRELGL